MELTTVSLYFSTLFLHLIDIQKPMHKETHFFVEKETKFSMENAEFSYYETNMPVHNIEFVFPKPVITMMLSGRKAISFSNIALELSPGSVFIAPSAEKIKVDIPEAKSKEPVNCIVLDVCNGFLQSFHHEIVEKQKLGWEGIQIKAEQPFSFMMTDNPAICNTMYRLYQNRINGKHTNLSFLLELNLKELAFWLFQTQARTLLLKNSDHIQGSFGEIIRFIQSHLSEKIQVHTLAKMACMSEPQFYKRFKETFGLSPIDYVNLKRIQHAKQLLTSSKVLVREVAFTCGFNSLEHFSRVFSQYNDGLSPKEFSLKQEQGVFNKQKSSIL